MFKSVVILCVSFVLTGCGASEETAKKQEALRIVREACAAQNGMIAALEKAVKLDASYEEYLEAAYARGQQTILKMDSLQGITSETNPNYAPNNAKLKALCAKVNWFLRIHKYTRKRSEIFPDLVFGFPQGNKQVTYKHYEWTNK